MPNSLRNSLSTSYDTPRTNSLPFASSRAIVARGRLLQLLYRLRHLKLSTNLASPSFSCSSLHLTAQDMAETWMQTQPESDTASMSSVSWEAI